jgi:NADPH:quinone reductase-like Zn-dependent oxidoreductase
MEYYNAIQIEEFGTSEVLKNVKLSLSEPKDDEVTIKITHAGIAFLDILMRKGSYLNIPEFPFTLGKDVVGYIYKVGKNVKNFKVGERVLSHLTIGGYAEFTNTLGNNVLKVSEKLDGDKLVALPLNYVTAYQLLYRVAKTKSMSRVLIHGGAGGVGTALLELAKINNIKAYATVSSLEKEKEVIKRGGIPINYKKVDFVSYLKNKCPEGIDVVFDPIGGEYWERSVKVLKNNGVLAAYGFSSFVLNDNTISDKQLPSIIAKLEDLKAYNINPIWYSITTSKMQKIELYFEDLSKIISLLEENKISPKIDSICSLKDVNTVHDIMEKGSLIGKVVIHL